MIRTTSRHSLTHIQNLHTQINRTTPACILAAGVWTNGIAHIVHFEITPRRAELKFDRACCSVRFGGGNFVGCAVVGTGNGELFREFNGGGDAIPSFFRYGDIVAGVAVLIGNEG